MSRIFTIMNAHRTVSCYISLYCPACHCSFFSLLSQQNGNGIDVCVRMCVCRAVRHAECVFAAAVCVSSLPSLSRPPQYRNAGCDSLKWTVSSNPTTPNHTTDGLTSCNVIIRLPHNENKLRYINECQLMAYMTST